ncbi:MAG: DUF3592 domain-containing protein [Bryobacteraceae bacterium]
MPARSLLLLPAVLCGFPALYLLAIVYTSPPVQATVSSRKLDISLGSSRRGVTMLVFDFALHFRTAAGQDLPWQVQLPTRRIEEALMFFDNYPPGKQTTIYRQKDGVALRRGLPHWRFGAGWGLAVFTLVFLFLYLVTGVMSFKGPWWVRPQRAMALMGLAPLTFGAMYYQTLQQKITEWPRVTAVVVKTRALPLLDQRAPDVRLDSETRKHLKDVELDSIRYTYQGRDYLYPGDHDVYAYPNDEHATYEKIVDPADPAALSEIPAPGDESFTGAYVFLGFGIVFVLFGLLIP